MKTPTPSAFGLTAVLNARARLAHGLRVTPCHIAPGLSDISGTTIWLKREDLQRTGSFKERGARNALLCLGAAARERGVVAASAGNHALGLAYHGAQLGVRVTVIMPATAPEIKVERCRGLGAHVLLRGATFDEAQVAAGEFAARTGASLIHPFDDIDVMAGQGTLALEVLEQVPDFDTMIIPVGGGGLLAGAATVLKNLRPHVRIVAVEPESAASFRAAREAGGPTAIPLTRTLADGLAVARVGATTFSAVADLVDEVVSVTENEIAQAIALFARAAGVVVEGAASAPLAALLAGKVRGRVVVLPVCGRNIDARLHAEIVAAYPLVQAGAQPRPGATGLEASEDARAPNVVSQRAA